MDWRTAERLARDWMVANGFPDAVLTAMGSDEGVDVRASDAVAQVKAHTRPVGRPDVQRIAGVGLHEGKSVLIFSTSGFSPAATAWADRASVSLLLLAIGGVHPLNATALDLTRRNVPKTARSALSPMAYQRDPTAKVAKERKRFKTDVRQTTTLGQRRMAQEMWRFLLRGETARVVLVANSTGSACVMITDKRLIEAKRGRRGFETRAYRLPDLPVLAIQSRALGEYLVYRAYGQEKRIRLDSRAEREATKRALQMVGRA